MSQSQGPTNPLLTLPGLGDDIDVGIPSRTPWWRRRGIIIGFTIFLIILLVGGGLLLALNRRRGVNYQFQSATNGTLSLSISATGPIQSGIYNLTFTGSGGKIDTINVNVGETVHKGQVLAQLDKTSLQDAVNQAQAAVIAAQNNLGSTQDSYSKSQAQQAAAIAAAQTTLSNDQANLTNTQNEGQASINIAQTTLSNDQTALTNTQKTAQASINSAQTTLNNDQTALQNTQAQSQAQLTAAQNQETAACPTPLPTAQQAACTSAEDNYTLVQAQTNSANANAQAKVNSDQQALAAAQATANANIAAAQAKINSDQQAIQQAMTTANANTSNSQAKITADQKALAQAQAQATATLTQSQGQVTTQQGSLASALSQLQTAQDNLANATLVAPHDGIVTIINGTVGGTPGTPATGGTSSAAGNGTFIQIVDTSALQVLADVNEADTANLKAGQVATFTVNAYGNRLFRGTVSAISPNGQTVSNVVSYPVYIDVDMSSRNLNGATLLPGMTANVTVTVLNRTNVLLIPVNALNFARVAINGNTTTGVPQLITSQEAASATAQARQMMIQLENQNPAITADSPTPAFVLERNGTQTVVKPIVVGLTDGTVYEVLAGLSPNEAIIVGTSTAARGLFSGGSSGLVGQSTHATV